MEDQITEGMAKGLILKYAIENSEKYIGVEELRDNVLPILANEEI